MQKRIAALGDLHKCPVRDDRLDERAAQHGPGHQLLLGEDVCAAVGLGRLDIGSLGGLDAIQLEHRLATEFHLAAGELEHHHVDGVADRDHVRYCGGAAVIPFGDVQQPVLLGCQLNKRSEVGHLHDLCVPVDAAGLGVGDQVEDHLASELQGRVVRPLELQLAVLVHVEFHVGFLLDGPRRPAAGPDDRANFVDRDAHERDPRRVRRQLRPRGRAALPHLVEDVLPPLLGLRQGLCHDLERDTWRALAMSSSEM